jgi:hypothetical protein
MLIPICLLGSAGRGFYFFLGLSFFIYKNEAGGWVISQMSDS